MFICKIYPGKHPWGINLLNALLIALNISGDFTTLLLINSDCLFLFQKLTFGSEIYHEIFIPYISIFNSNIFSEKSFPYIW